MGAGYLWEARVPTCNNNAFTCRFLYNDVLARQLGLAIGFKDKRVLKREKVVAACKQLQLFQIL